MSQELPSGVHAKTGWLPLDREGEEFLHYVEVGSSPQTPMDEAVEALRKAFTDPALKTDPVFRKFKNYLKTYYPQRERGRSEEEVIRIYSTLEEPPIDHLGLDYDDPGPAVELLGQELPRNDLIGFTHYLMTNTTVPEGLEDPRLKFLDELRAPAEVV